MQFCIMFYKGTVQYSILLLELLFCNVHANRFTSKHSYSRNIAESYDRQEFYIYYIQFPHEVHRVKETTFYLENYNSSTQTTYSLIIKPQDLLLGESTEFYKRNSSNILLNWNKNSTTRSLHTIGISLGQVQVLCI